MHSFMFRTLPSCLKWSGFSALSVNSFPEELGGVHWCLGTELHSTKEITAQHVETKQATDQSTNIWIRQLKGQHSTYLGKRLWKLSWYWRRSAYRSSFSRKFWPVTHIRRIREKFPELLRRMLLTWRAWHRFGQWSSERKRVIGWVLHVPVPDLTAVPKQFGMNIP